MNDTKQQWFKEAKFGLFIHFGLYSQLGGEWKGKVTPFIAEWIMNTFDIPMEEYRKLADTFDPVNFDAEQIAEKAASWGMKYLVVTSKHHEGFALYDSDCSDYTSVKAAPCHRDFVAELQEACRKNGLKFGVYYSQAQDWDDPDGYMARHDNSGKNYRAYLERKCFPQLRELLTKYPDISLIWFDTPMGTTPEESKEMIDLVKSINPNVIISGRIGNGLGEYMTTGDNFIPSEPFMGDWEVPATLNDTWGYKETDHNWKDPERILRLLLKINSRGGNYLLNIGPDGTGKVPEESIEILDKVGGYVHANEDAIRATQYVPVFPYDLEWCLFTRKAHKFFIHVTEPQVRPEIINFNATIQKAYILENGKEVGWEIEATCEGPHILSLTLPEEYKERDHYCICLEIEEEQPVFEEIRL
ncbi:MAG: alpha-L-fucosidase [Eubacteriales bacterium]|nr:alpha-L-fucosidase [Eubacteriales bacterium]